MPIYDFKKVLKPYLAAKAGKHHEIYIGDPRKTAPSKLKTILRHSVQ